MSGLSCSSPRAVYTHSGAALMSVHSWATRPHSSTMYTTYTTMTAPASTPAAAGYTQVGKTAVHSTTQTTSAAAGVRRRITL